MKPALVDTDILSMFFRHDANVMRMFREYLSVYDCINISIITYYEILSGLYHKRAFLQVDLFFDFVSRSKVFHLTEESVKISANLYAELRNSGNVIDDGDILILVLVTNNRRHFEKISGLEICNWSE